MIHNVQIEIVQDSAEGESFGDDGTVRNGAFRETMEVVVFCKNTEQSMKLRETLKPLTSARNLVPNGGFCWLLAIMSLF